MTHLNEGSARRRDCYLTTHNTHKRQTSMSTAVFETAISASCWPQAMSLDWLVKGIDIYHSLVILILDAVFSLQYKLRREQHLPVVHVSITFVVHWHDVQEHDVSGRRLESTESHLDSGEHPPTGEIRKNTDNTQFTTNRQTKNITHNLR
jgi:hypothetical protein